MNRLVVILAGYKADIDALMGMNEGLQSRFDYEIVFRSFSVDDGCQLMRMKLDDPEVNLKLSPEAEAALPAEMDRLVRSPVFANGRDIGNWVKRLESIVALRGDSALTPADLRDSLTRLLASRKHLSSVPSIAPTAPVAAPTIALAPPPPSPVLRQEQATKAAPPPPTPPRDDAPPESRDPLSDLIKSHGGEVDWNDPLFIQKAAKLLPPDSLAKRLAEARAFKQLKADHVAREAKRQADLNAKLAQLAELMKREEEEARKAKEEAERKRREAEVRRLQAEQEELQRAEAARAQKEQAVQLELQRRGLCPALFPWFPDGTGGYRCGGGTHYVRLP